MIPTVTVSRKGADRARARHQWIYRSDVERADEARGGDVVRVVDARGRLLGTAFFSDASQIALRLVAFEHVDPDRAFWRGRLVEAKRLRERVVEDATAYRLVHSEGDMLSSLVIDRYGDVFSIQTLSQGTERLKPLFVELLDELFSPHAIVERNDGKVRDLEGLPRSSGVLTGSAPDEVEVQENGVRYLVDLVGGQKTGAFLDQRENRAAARRYAHGRALDCFSFHGSFALHLVGPCERVTILDVSAAALERAGRNADLNGVRDRVELLEANVFDVLHEFERRGERFGTIVLDPPAFAKHRNAVEAAVRGYKDINMRAIKLLEPGGVLVTASCSYHVREDTFLGIVAEAAADAGRTLRVLERRMQARDHPVMLGVPETHYLKCLIAEVVGSR